MLPAETFALRKRLLALPLAKPKYNTERSSLKTYELFIIGDIHYITDLFCRNVLNIATP
jgi:hypothetical protein